ncbi:Fat storage-inducing transmembrane protein, partial [Sporodiniella umbellata]
VTQGCWGPSVIDRIYVLTGGGCQALQKDMAVSTLGPWTTILEQRLCRKVGGFWHGGHDISGHCVILIHASMFFWEELAWIFYDVERFLRIKKQNSLQYFSILAIFALAAIWWFMLFQTAVYFHGHFEILSGTFFGLLGWAILYLGIFPRFLE